MKPPTSIYANLILTLPFCSREVVVMKWDDIGIAAMRYAKGLYAMLRSLTARHSHAGRAIQVVPIVTNTATAVRTSRP